MGARAQSRAFVLAVALAVSACASSLPQTNTAAIGVEVEGRQKDGGYKLTAREAQLGCPMLGAEISTIAGRMQAHIGSAKAERDNPPQTVSAMFQRMGGGSKGLAAIGRYNEDRTHAVALRASATQKRCALPEADKKFEEAEAKLAEFNATAKK